MTLSLLQRILTGSCLPVMRVLHSIWGTEACWASLYGDTSYKAYRACSTKRPCECHL